MLLIYIAHYAIVKRNRISRAERLGFGVIALQDIALNDKIQDSFRDTPPGGCHFLSLGVYIVGSIGWSLTIIVSVVGTGGSHVFSVSHAEHRG